MKKGTARAVISIAILGAGIGGYAVLHATKPEPEQKDDGPRPVSLFVERANRQTLNLAVVTQGEVKPRTEIDMVAQISGRIEWVAPNFVTGASVKSGETLVRIEPVDFELAVIRAESRVAEAQTRVQLREANAEIARRNWDDSIVGEPTPLAMKIPQLEEAKAMLRSAQADLDSAKLALARTRISIPFSGRVREKKVDVGQFVSAGTSLGRVYSTDTVEIRLPLTDRQLADVGLPIGFEASAMESGPEVALSAEVAGQMRKWAGRISRVESAIDPSTRVFYAVAEVESPYGDGADAGVPLAIGLFVNARIAGRRIENALVIPRNALRSMDTVYVVSAGDTLDIRRISIGYADTDRVVVTSGLHEGERVVTSPVRDPRQGMTVAAMDNKTASQLALSGQ